MYGGRNYNHSHHHHHHYPNHHHKGAPPPQTGVALSPESALAADIFEQFISASTFKSVLHHYRHMCDVLRLRPQNIRHFYPKLKNKIRSWKAQALWTKFDKRAAHKCYNHGKSCNNTKLLIIGAGPCGLRTAIEAQLLGAKVVVVEKRDRFSRNNVLHLWPFVITDLKALGAKKFYGKFCAGAIDHISIRQLQCILLKVALLLGVEVFEGVTFEELLEPPEDQSQKIGWHARFSPVEHPVNEYEFDVLIGADGKRNTLMGFKRKEFRGKLAIAITANFINKHSEQEARVQEISGVAFIFNQKFFKDLYAATGIDLENIVYYKDETHYFVMTAKKHSLIDKGVILRDLPDTHQLLHPNNVDREALCAYAREAADFSTGYQMPHLDFAVNHYGKPDIAMFDFTSMFAAENACRVVETRGHKLLQCLVGDSLLEPFWPTGSGCARGFLSSFDSGWAIRSWASNRITPLEVIAERESIYRLLAQTTPENLSKDYSSYTLEPSSRYPTINLKVLLPFQVRHLFITDEPDAVKVEPIDGVVDDTSIALEDLPRKRKRRDSLIQPDTLLSWCQKQVASKEDMTIENLSSSFKDGRALCTILHRYRPDLLDLENVDPSNPVQNCQLAFDIFEREFGIPPVMTGSQLAEATLEETPDLVAYISQIHDALRGEIPHSMGAKPPLKVLKGQSLEGLDLEDFPHQPRLKLEKPYFENNFSNSSSVSSQRNGRISCRVLEEPKPETALQQNKKRRNEFGSLDANAYQRQEDIARNRAERIRKQKEQRELDTVRFVRSMRMLHCDQRDIGPNALPPPPSYRQAEDPGIAEYRKNAKSMRQKAQELERKLYFPDKMNEDGVDKVPGAKQRGLSDPSEDFSDRVKGLEAKFKGEYDSSNQQKPKDLIRAVGKLEKTDWNLSAIERKIEENPKPAPSAADKERVPKWSRDNYNDKFQNIERRLRENGEDEERIAKYLDIDASLKRLERKLREGSTLETGLRGHNKVSNLANQLSSKLVRREDDSTMKTTTAPKQARTMVLPTSESDLCYFCGTRVYLVERLSAEGKFFHRQCFKCSYCGALLRLGNYIYDRENRYGGKFFCIPHFGLTVRSRAPKKPEEMTPKKQLEAVGQKDDDAYGRVADAPLIYSGGVAGTPGDRIKGDSKRSPHLLSPSSKGSSPLDRGTTPERVEFENSVIEASDEDEYLSEDEWTDRNFGTSANELDDEDDDDDDSDYSDLSDEEVDEEALLETSQKMTADETRRLAESWKRRYSNGVFEMSDDDQESFSDSENEDMSEHGAEGDESHTPTEGEIGDDDDDEDDEGDQVRRARELRRLEVNINVEAPPRKAETSESGSETEVGSEDESDTQIDTDSEFADDSEAARAPKQIPTIVIDETPKEEGKESAAALSDDQPSAPPPNASEQTASPYGNVDEKYVSQVIDTGSGNQKDGAERSASLTNISTLPNGPNPRTEQLKRLLQRTESTEAVTAQRNYLRRQYLLGNTSNVPRKSVSTADIGNKFKSFMDKISETQKKLNPAPQPSPAMQAFLNLSNKGHDSSSGSSLIKEPTKLVSSNSQGDSLLSEEKLEQNHDTLQKSDESSDSSSKSEEGKLITFSKPKDDECSPDIPPFTEHTNFYGQEKVITVTPSIEAQEIDIRPLSPSEKDKKKEILLPLKSPVEGEKGSIDSEQPEKGHLEKEAKDPVEDELRPDDRDDVELIEAINVAYVEEEPAENVEALNMEIISGQNLKNVSEALCEAQELVSSERSVKSLSGKVSETPLEPLLQRGSEPLSFKEFQDLSCPVVISRTEALVPEASKENLLSDSDVNIDEDFDKLASDAMTELARSESNSPHQTDLLVKELDFDVGEIQSSDLDRNSDSKVDADLPSSERRQDESGFRSQEDHKTQSSDVDPQDLTQKFPQQGNAGLTTALGRVDSSEAAALLSPETEAVTTEADLSDWAEGNEAFAINADEFETEFGSPVTERAKRRFAQEAGIGGEEDATPRTSIARIASLESLGDSDSAISVSVTKPVTSAVSPFCEMEHLEYMDTSSGDSSPEEPPSVSIRYNPLQERTPTTPSTPNLDFSFAAQPQDASKELQNMMMSKKSKSLDMEEVLKEEVPCRSSSQPHQLEKESPLQESSLIESSLQESSVQESSLQESSIQESLLQEESSTQESSLRDSSQLESPLEEPLMRESLLQEESSSSGSSSKSSPSKRYEGYFPRFKDRVTPFRLARDSIDVHKTSSSKPLFTPSKEDVVQRERDEAQRLGSLASPPLQPPRSFPSEENREKPVRGPKAKDGELVRAMVMSRMPKKNADKGRRGSRNALHLSLHSSSSSLFGSEPSLELATPKDTTPKDTTSKDTTSKDTTPKDTTPKDTTPKDTTPKDTAPKDTTPNEQVPPSTEKKNDVLKATVGDFSSNRCPSSSYRKGLGTSSVEDSSSKKVPSPSLESKVTPPRSVLPATPLTHPERFKREETVKRELFKSSPQLNPSSPLSQASSPPSHSSFNSSLYSTPPEFPYLQSQNVSLSKSLVNTSSDASLGPRLRRSSESEGNRSLGSEVELKEKAHRDSYRKKEEAERPRKDPDERLKQLLEERRRRESEDQREVRLRNKTTCLQECLEEYRQKRSSAPVFMQSGSPSPSASPAKEMGQVEAPPTRVQLGLAPQRQTYRPSLLELETMQIFSSSPTRSVCESSAPMDGVSRSTVVNSSLPGDVLIGSSPSSPPSSSAPVPVPPQNGKEKTPEKKPVKKSKDRERRRSLIQVVAGMFAKSDEKKKEKEDTGADSSSPKKDKSDSPASLSPGAAPKSPSVKERFSKLRLSRSKEKKKPSSEGKNRSASADVPPRFASEGRAHASPLSLPTSPSRTIFSFLSSSPARPHERTRNSTSEENISEDEVTPGGGTPLSKDSPSSLSTPSLRRQRATQRAAKQAEQKRLRMAQEIQRQLEECEVKTRELEERGINVEKALIGEMEGVPRDEADLMKEWFSLVHEKNALVRWQEELTVKARELELEDRHLRLEHELRQRMTSAERAKTRGDIEREGKILAEIISIIEQKDALVNLLEEDRQRYAEEDRDLELVHARKVQQRPLYERETGV